jgi:hypothetical protein
MWLDPGLTTGIARWYPVTDEFYSEQVFGMLEASFHVRDILTVSSDEITRPVIGWEAFVIRPGSSHLDLDTTALEVIGTTKMTAADLNATVPWPQQPADRSLGEKHLMTVGWYKPGCEHANAAAAHLLSYLIESRLISTEMLAKIAEKMETD